MKTQKYLYDKNSSYMEPKTDGAQKYTGKIIIKSSTFRFSLNLMDSGNYIYRGSMSLLSPLDDSVQKVEKKLLESSEDPIIASKSITTSIYSNSNVYSEIWEYLIKKAFNLYASNLCIVIRSLSHAVSPETVFPEQAFVLFGDRFISSQFGSCKQSTKDKRRRSLSHLCALLKEQPMRDFTINELSKFLKQNKVTSENANLLSDFWQFCIDSRFCGGGNPVPIVKKDRRKSAQRLANRAITPDRLSPERMIELLELLRNESSGAKCGVALQVGAGIPAKECCALTWGHLVFRDDLPDFVEVLLLKTDNASATHIYSRPIIPFAALVLWERYHELLKTVSKKILKNYPIVSMAKDPSKALSYNDLIRYSTTMLRRCGVTNKELAALRTTHEAAARFLLENTYRGFLTNECGLANDDLTMQFLSGKSLASNVSADNYASFTDEDASFRLYTILRRVQLTTDLNDSTLIKEALPNGMEKIFFYPDNSKSNAVAMIEDIVLQPGQSISISCVHGTQFDVKPREIGQDGKPIRKRKKQSDNSVT